MSRFLSIAMLAAAGLLISAEARAETMLYVSQVSKGVYEVYDASNNSTVYVRDVEAYIKSKYESSKVDGFGGRLTSKDFSKGATPVADAAKAASVPLNYAVGTAYNVANMSPSWRKVTVPLRALFGAKKKTAAQPGTSF